MNDRETLLAIRNLVRDNPWNGTPLGQFIEVPKVIAILNENDDFEVARISAAR